MSIARLGRKKTGRGSAPLWLRIGVTSILMCGLLVGALVYATHDPNPIGHFRSEEGRRAYAASYRAAMQQLPTPARTMDLNTDFGTVRVYEFSRDQTRTLPPVVLLPGRSSGVPMWEANLAGLARARTVYALDALGDAGLSVQTRRIEDSADQAAWLDQIVGQLGPSKVHMVGHSFGGWSAANYAVRHPSRLASLMLLEPVFVFQGLRWQVYVASIPASVSFVPRRWRNKMLSAFGGVDVIDFNDPVIRMISDGTEHYVATLPLPERLSSQQLHGLSMPVYVALAGNSFLHDSAAAAQVAEETIENRQVRMFPGATHSLPLDLPDVINRQLLAFMAAHDSD